MDTEPNIDSLSEIINMTEVHVRGTDLKSISTNYNTTAIIIVN